METSFIGNHPYSIICTATFPQGYRQGGLLGNFGPCAESIAYLTPSILAQRISDVPELVDDGCRW